jgi:RNA polymerase sigma-70 factor (ECF subfamily)
MVEIAYGDALEAEQAGFADFFRAEYETLLRAIYLISGSRDEAEELAQDTFVKACERWDRVREMENPAGYLYRTAVNKRRSVARRLRVAAQRAFSLRPPDVIAQSDDRDQIRRALALLPESQREAIVLVEWLGLTDAEAGRVLGVSAGAVRVRISRAKASLRPLMERSPA